MRVFRPTWLYVKKHSVTGLLYFGKTTLIDPKNYLGSGKYWRNHLNIHGKDIETIWCELFTDYNDLTDFAELFSSFFDIVKSPNWANLIAENGLDGGSDKGRPGHTFSEESRKKISLANTGRIVSEETCQKISEVLTGRKISEETKERMRDSNRSGSDEVREKISNSSKGKLFSEESRKKMSDAKRGRKRGPMSPETREKISNAMKNRIGDLTLI
jgi:hypothetical protein